MWAHVAAWGDKSAPKAAHRGPLGGPCLGTLGAAGGPVRAVAGVLSWLIVQLWAPLKSSSLVGLADFQGVAAVPNLRGAGLLLLLLSRISVVLLGSAFRLDDWRLDDWKRIR